MTKPPNYVTIAEARLNPKGTSLIVKVASIGELKSGESKSGDKWKRQQAVLVDKSDNQELTLWGGDIGRIEQGKFYKLVTPYWKEYEGDLQLSLGKYCIVQECTESDLLPSSSTGADIETKGIDFAKLNAEREAQKNTEPTKPIQVNPDLLKTAQEIIGIAKLPGVNLRLNTVWAIEMIVRDYLIETEKKTPDSARVGMYVKLVLDGMETK